MIPPIIIVEDVEVEVYESVQEVGIYLEPPYFYINPPKGVRIMAYDSLGYVLELSEGITEVEYQFLFLKWKRRYRGVILNKRIPEENREDELRKILIDYLVLMKRGEKEDLQGVTTTELIRKASW